VKSIVLDPIVLAAAIGVVASPVAGWALVRGFDVVPQRSRRAVEWLMVGAVVAVATLCELSSDGPAKEFGFIRLLGALPGIIAFVAWRTAMASALVSLVPLYFGVGAMTLGRPLHTPEIALDRLIPVQPAWMLVYASLYVFALMPLLVVRQRELFDRAMRAYVMVLAVAYVGFLRDYPRDAVEERDRRRAPVRALAVVAVFGMVVAGFWMLYAAGAVGP
jgi:hypothetical protein